ncbi:ribulose kinase [Sphaerochaeta pleomorpha str. Grapes]|uniref:Ribulose kinase n=1 Tax=Sphaerochaeta pleomorpha (strain ATCC BAA-1885 / DSM 22778 / Grapes) TaxID=158190 RepID=G8QTG0_SPHPG|nr:ribulokinase [Sphaerochaeta pleomorpha]AEV30201.1 ribulose kinase [Sphaerochaeta pleomorpha str. Grapes]
MIEKILAGIDFGTDSVRVLLCDAVSGKELSHGVAEYARWKIKEFCNLNENQYRQHALDYLEGIVEAFQKALSKLPGNTGKKIVALSVDTTGSTPCPVDMHGRPLCLLPGFENNPDAMFHLWKDHTAAKEAIEINDILCNGDIDYTKFQGVYSSEWFWAKILHTVRKSQEVKKNAYTWIEHSDWMLGILTGIPLVDDFPRGSCAAGHKALWNSEFHGLPSRAVFSSLDPYLGLIYDRYPLKTYPAGTPIGRISAYWADTLGINPMAMIVVGSLDAHAGGVGAGIAKKTMVKVIGTSTVDLVIENADVLKNKDLREICGQAEDSIVPGYTGIEMGQPSFGDSYLWVKNLSLWPLLNLKAFPEFMSEEYMQKLIDHIDKNFLRELEMKAGEHIYDQEVSLDWFNGRRYPSLNEHVKSMISQISLGTDLPALFCAVAKGTVFGSRRIFDSLKEKGILIDKVVAVGGIAEKSEFIMQMLADVMNIPIAICSDFQVCAKGSVIYASVGAGIFSSIPEAQKRYCTFDSKLYKPNASLKDLYESQYRQYLEMGKLSETFANINIG